MRRGLSIRARLALVYALLAVLMLAAVTVSVWLIEQRDSRLTLERNARASAADLAVAVSAPSTDGDGDGYGAGTPTLACEPPEGTVSQDGDCDDADATVFPGAPERCDGHRNDCTPGEEPRSTWYLDGDGDGTGGEVSWTGCAPRLPEDRCSNAAGPWPGVRRLP
mgnify:CR=1 FL=1